MIRFTLLNALSQLLAIAGIANISRASLDSRGKEFKEYLLPRCRSTSK